MPVFTLEGIILKRSNYGEADRLLTIVTPFKGKISVIAKGVRRITSRRAGNVELLNKVRMHMFQAQGMPLLTEAESLQTFQRIKSDLTLSSYASHIAEITNKLLPENQPNYGVYQLLLTILQILEKNPRQIFIRAYEVKLMTELGFWSLNQLEVDEEIKEILHQLQMKSWSQIEQMELTQPQAVELERILRYYIEKILEGPLKSAEVIRKIKETKQ